MASNDEMTKLWRIRKTVHQLLKDRKYLVSAEELERSKDSFKEAFTPGEGLQFSRDNLTILAPKLDNPDELVRSGRRRPKGARSPPPSLSATLAALTRPQVFVFFPDEEKVGVKRIKVRGPASARRTPRARRASAHAAPQEYAQRMRDEKVTRAIIVVQTHMTPFARQSLLETERTNFRMEQFLEPELLVNITKHVLVPSHEVLDPAAKKQLLERYKVSDGQLPRIQITDPVARYYGLTRGQVVRIIRPSETAGRYVTYRLCV